MEKSTRCLWEINLLQLSANNESSTLLCHPAERMIRTNITRTEKNMTNYHLLWKEKFYIEPPGVVCKSIFPVIIQFCWCSFLFSSNCIFFHFLVFYSMAFVSASASTFFISIWKAKSCAVSNLREKRQNRRNKGEIYQKYLYFYVFSIQTTIFSFTRLSQSEDFPESKPSPPESLLIFVLDSSSTTFESLPIFVLDASSAT